MRQTLDKDCFTLCKYFVECYTRQRVFGGEKTGKTSLSSAIYRVLSKQVIVTTTFPVIHSAKKNMGENENRKDQKKSKTFFNRALHNHFPFFGHVSQLVQPTGFKLITSLSCVTCSTTPPLSHMCLYYIFLTHILYQTEFKLIV